MSYVVTVLSWTGWIWTGAFFAVVVPLLALRSRHRRLAAGEAAMGPEQDDHG